MVTRKSNFHDEFDLKAIEETECRQALSFSMKGLGKLPTNFDH